MKGVSMKVPVLNQIFSQKQIYKAHQQKLLQIRLQRKSHLGNDPHRLLQLESMKRNLNSFALKFNEKNSQISQSNIQFVKKLEQVQPTYPQARRSVLRSERYLSHSSLHQPKLLERYQREKENERIMNKVKSMSSSINSKSLSKDYAKNLLIKNRLLRYASQTPPNRGPIVVLKTEKYLGNTYAPHENRKNSTLHSSHPRQPVQPVKYSSVSHIRTKPELGKQKMPKLFYQKDEILKNRLIPSLKIFKTNRDSKLKNIHEKQVLRTQPQQVKIKQNESAYNFMDQEMPENEEAFFPTELGRQTAQ